MNPYKAAWYVNTLVDAPSRPPKEISRRQRSRFTRDKGVQASVAQTKQDAMLYGAYEVSKYASKSQLTGKLGMAVRVGGRVGLRVVPVIGMAMFAYDVYQLGKWITQD